MYLATEIRVAWNVVIICSIIQDVSRDTKKSLVKAYTPALHDTLVSAKRSCSPHKSPCHAQSSLSETVSATEEIQGVDTPLSLSHFVHLQEKSMWECCSLFVWKHRLVYSTDLKEPAGRNVITLKAKFIPVCLGYSLALVPIGMGLYPSETAWPV